jgi:phosphate transport system permease protein
MAAEAEARSNRASERARPLRGSSSTGEVVARVVLACCATVLVIAIIAIFGFVGSKGLSTFTKDHISLSTFFTSTRWIPQSARPGYGALAIILGSLMVTGLAIVLGAPLSVIAALFIVEVGPPRYRGLLQPVVEVFVGIPSVVYGWIGLKTLVPLIRNHFGGLGFSLLAGGLVLSIMILPTVTTVATDALRRLPVSLKEASFGLGATRWQTIWSVLLPAALPGILTGVVLGIARAIGEALAVQMVIGNAAIIPSGITDRASTLTSIITLDMGNTVQGSAWNDALWSMALLLLLIALALIVLIRWLGSRRAYA